MVLALSASFFEFNQSLLYSLGNAAAVRNVIISARVRTSGPSGPKLNSDQARLDAQVRKVTRQVQGFTKLEVKQDRAVRTIEKEVERLTEMKDILLEARELIINAQETGVTAEAKRDLVNSFDQKLGKLILLAKGLEIWAST